MLLALLAVMTVLHYANITPFVVSEKTGGIGRTNTGLANAAHQLVAGATRMASSQLGRPLVSCP